MKTKFLYFNGDSNTAGTGLSDYKFFKEYPGDSVKQPSTDSLHKWQITLSKWYAQTNETFVRQQHYMNQKFSYAGKIGKLLNYEVFNGSVGGSSMFTITNRTIHDLTVLKSQNKIPDQVIIGLTSKERLTKILPTKNNDPAGWTSGVSTQWIDLDNRYDFNFKNYAKNFWVSHTDVDILILFLWQCISLKHAVKSLTGKFPIFLRTLHEGNNSMQDLYRNNRHPMLDEAWNILNFDEIYNQKSIREFGNQYGFVADGHCNVKASEEYAKYIIEYLTASNWDPLNYNLTDKISNYQLSNRWEPTYYSLDNLSDSRLVYKFKNNGKIIQLFIVLNNSIFVAKWKNYLLKLSKNLPTISFNVQPCFNELKNIDVIPFLNNLHSAFKNLQDITKINYKNILSVIEYIQKNNFELTQSNLNDWHRNFTWLLSSYTPNQTIDYDAFLINAHEINKNVHALENYVYYNNSDTIKTNIKKIGRIFCTNADDSNHITELEELFGKNAELITDTFDYTNQDYNFTVWLNEDIKGKDQIKAWAENDNLSAPDITGNLFMTPNIMLDPELHIKTILDNEDFRNASRLSNKTLNRWPLGNLLNPNDINWSDFEGAILKSVELDDVVLWEQIS